jgi:3-oxoacyl-[acyl-carrier protein] reductase
VPFHRADDLDVGRLFTETDVAFGGVDVVVHAVGRLSIGSVVDCEPATFDALLVTNARGAFLVNRQAARQLRDGGAIVNLCSSIVGLTQLAYGAYVTSMSAVEAMTPILARELGERRITMNAVGVAPGPADSADGVAGLVAFLVGRAGRCINGQVIPAATPFRPSQPRRST